MSQVNAIIDGLVEDFVTLAMGVQARRFALGEVVRKMIDAYAADTDEETPPPWTTITRKIKTRMPNAKDVLGYAITKPNLEAMLELADTFRANDGLMSEDGEHRIDRDDVQALGLTPTEGASLARLVKAGKIRVKTVAGAARAVRKGGKGAAKAMDQIKILARNEGTVPTSEVSLDDLRKDLERTEKQIAKAQEKATELRLAIQAREEAVARDEGQAEDSTSVQAEPTTAAPPVRESSRPRARKPRKQADATVSA